MPPTSEQSLYSRVMGDAFESLAPHLREFHQRAPAAATGSFSVIRPRSRLKGLLGTLAGFPPAGSDVPLALSVTRQGKVEQWRRTFGKHPFPSRQWIWRDLLVEAAGPLAFGLRLAARDKGYTMTTQRVWMLGLPIPLVLAPRALASVVPNPTGWQAHIVLTFPVLGEMLRYEGNVVITAERESSP